MNMLDSNLIIYATKEDYKFLRVLITDADSCVSIITKLESLGYHNLSATDKVYLEGVFNTTTVFSIDGVIIEQAVLLRQTKKMSVGDAIIAATALLNGFDLYTNNVKDFVHISGLTVINPLDNQ